MQNGSRHPVSLWVAAFALTAALQIFRGALSDTIIFVSGGILILISTNLLAKLSLPSARLTSGMNLDWAGMILLFALGFTPRHTFFNLGIFVLLLPLVLFMSWGTHSEPRRELTRRDRVTRRAWTTWAVAMCLWEFGANIAGQISKKPDAFPTISVLVDPLLKLELGQAGFVVVWLLVGYYLLKAGTK
jgi:hypothetical protein